MVKQLSLKSKMASKPDFRAKFSFFSAFTPLLTHINHQNDDFSNQVSHLVSLGELLDAKKALRRPIVALNWPKKA